MYDGRSFHDQHPRERIRRHAEGNCRIFSMSLILGSLPSVKLLHTFLALSSVRCHFTFRKRYKRSCIILLLAVCLTLGERTKSVINPGSSRQALSLSTACQLLTLNTAFYLWEGRNLHHIDYLQLPCIFFAFVSEYSIVNFTLDVRLNKRFYITDL